MGDDENEHERPRKANRRGMNYFGFGFCALLSSNGE
jgi:hypothetical protein